MAAGGRQELTIQANVDGHWHDAAIVVFHDEASGHRGATTTSYSVDYFVCHASVDYASDSAVRDRRAVSVMHPVDLEDRHLPHWPAFLMDMLPQGLGRHFIARSLGINPILASAELPLISYAGGAPVGNLRIREAWEHEHRSVGRFDISGLPAADILQRSDRFIALLASLPAIAPSAVSLQGEWPKVMMSLGVDGLYYPSGTLPDEAVSGEFIVKIERTGKGHDSLILELEAIYSGVAEDAGLDVRGRSVSGRGVIVIPRFDRASSGGSLRIRGQESIVSAIGVSEFAHVESHERYLEMLASVSSRPGDDVAEYVKRDILNLCFGNDDNHGRNTALTKYEDGTIRLSPVFDFAPMRLAKEAISRSSKWRMMRGRGSDFRPDWGLVLRTVTQSMGGFPDLLADIGDFAEGLPHLASQAVARCSDTSAALHATSRLDDIVRDVTEASDALMRNGHR